MQKRENGLENMMASIAFAEEGEFDKIREEFGYGEKGRKAMETKKGKGVKRKPYLKALVYGSLSVALYALLLARQDWLTSNFTIGGVNALFPVATAFIFSFVHGTFTGDFWTVMGVEAAHKKGAK